MRICLNHLPYWVSRKVFLQISGISSRALSELVKKGQVRRLELPQANGRKCRKGLYYRVDLENLVSTS